MRRALLIAAATVLTAGPAWGSNFDLFGFGSRALGMGGALTAEAVDYHAAYYNPANLLLRKQVHLGLGIQYVEPFLGFDRDQPSANASVIPERNLGFHLGISAPFGGVFKERLGFGAALYLPLLKTTRVQLLDFDRPQYVMYDSLPDKLILAVGGSGEVLSWLHIGAGFQLLADLTGTADMTLSVVDGRFTRRRLSFDLHADVAATAGITVTPVEGLRIGVSYRQELALSFGLPVRANITEVGTLAFDISGTSLYTPHQINAGISWRLPWVPLTLATDVTVALWSLAPAPSASASLRLDASKLSDQGSTEPVLQAETPSVGLQAQDIAIVRFGAEYLVGDFALRAGYAFRPTPIPGQPHATNYVDSDAHLVSAGAAWTFPDPTDVQKKPLTVGVGLQATLLRARRYDKADPTDLTGGYTARGAVLVLGVDLQHDF